MISCHVVNFNFSSQAGRRMPAFRVTVGTEDLAAAENPVARLYSIDFANETVGRPLPITRNGTSWEVVVLPPQLTCNTTIDRPPKGQIRSYVGLFAGVSTAPTVQECAALCCQTDGCVLWSLDTPWIGSWRGCVNGKPCCALASGPVAGFRPYAGAMNITVRP